ncbi:hypothetical protein SAMN04487949_0733 [Halogranum gelatinilyticum]|uniref:Uncharacterized protein n=1 Tax=Halogranum gelatinilyticum TaxID=660521 RepID=A0A1G9Q8H3_9EURY|nr:hypothetical protein [Halogranum gelatinilyticum]SDM07250.1 hypothetical protein SAMN04487949_0733 [Halogranum gelatinilyticum]
MTRPEPPKSSRKLTLVAGLVVLLVALLVVAAFVVGQRDRQPELEPPF